jgi:hypothetical protein
MPFYYVHIVQFWRYLCFGIALADTFSRFQLTRGSPAEGGTLAEGQCLNQDGVAVDTRCGSGAVVGGSLMGAVGLDGAVAQAGSPADRMQAASASWDRWAPVNAAAVGTPAT